MTDWWQANPLPVGRADFRGIQYPSLDKRRGREECVLLTLSDRPSHEKFGEPRFCQLFHCVDQSVFRERLCDGRGASCGFGCSNRVQAQSGGQQQVEAMPTDVFRACPGKPEKLGTPIYGSNFVAKLGGSKWVQAQPASVPDGFSTGKRILSWLTLLW